MMRNSCVFCLIFWEKFVELVMLMKIPVNEIKTSRMHKMNRIAIVFILFKAEIFKNVSVNLLTLVHRYLYNCTYRDRNSNFSLFHSPEARLLILLSDFFT